MLTSILEHTPMDIDNGNLKTLIDKEFNELLKTMEGNSKVLQDIVNIFINETPVLFEKIEMCIVRKQWGDAAELVHHVKTRYGYFGLPSVVEQLSHWENMLVLQTSMDHQYWIDNLKKVNAQLITELQQTGYYIAPKETGGLLLAGIKVLIAEDDEINAKIFALFIEETGASVAIARDGEEALQKAVVESPDIIFMDVHMPVYTGLEVIRELRKQGVTCPIISLSASGQANEYQNSLEAGANEFLIKPADRKSILETLFKYIKKNK